MRVIEVRLLLGLILPTKPDFLNDEWLSLFDKRENAIHAVFDNLTGVAFEFVRESGYYCCRFLGDINGMQALIGVNAPVKGFPNDIRDRFILATVLNVLFELLPFFPAQPDT